MSAFEKEVGHFLPRWRVMLHLYEAQEPYPQKQLGQASHMDPGALSRQLSSLEALGWIARSTDQHDKRITNVTLTQQGKQQVEQSLPKRAAFIENSLGDLPDKQLRQLMDSLIQLESRFSSVHDQDMATEDASA
jgi:DNA-binding MarR family transcriptional regulator